MVPPPQKKMARDQGPISRKNRTANEVRSLYGLDDPAISSSRANEIVQSVFDLFHKQVDEAISKEEVVGLLESGRDLPDCEFDGHHGDEEWEVRRLVRSRRFSRTV